MFNLKGKTALVTGASSGIGRQACLTLANAGAIVIGTSRSISRLEKLKKEIEQTGGQFQPASLDLANSDAISTFVTELNDSFPAIDILVNNAGFGEPTPISNHCLESWDYQHQVNLRGPWLLTQSVAKQMIERKTAGSIINIASIAGDGTPYIGGSAYGASKAGILQLTRTLVGELSPHNIRINAISPGLIYTSLTQKRIDAERKHLEARTPLGFIANPSDLSGTILLLACNQASRYITGSTFTIDGGLSAHAINP